MFWDINSETRYLVLPMRPAGTEGWPEDDFAELVTRDSMIGTGICLLPPAGYRHMNGIHDMGGMHGMGPLTIEESEPPFQEDWERATFGLVILQERLRGCCTRDRSATSTKCGSTARATNCG